VLEYIELRPDVCGGRPVIAGTRLEVAIILEMMDSGYSIEEIIDEYPFLSDKILKYVMENRKSVERYVEASNYYEIDPNRVCGMVVVAGTRLPVLHIYDMLDSGYSISEILEEYPFLTYGVVRGLIEYRDIIEPLARSVERKIAFQK